MANPISVEIVGNALNSDGFTGEGTIAGLGLNTMGFLWPTYAIWVTCEVDRDTVWVTCTNCTGSC